MAKRRYPTLTLYMSAEEQADISRVAGQMSISKSELVRMACRQYIDGLAAEGTIKGRSSVPANFDEWRALVISRMKSLGEQIAAESRYYRDDGYL